MNDIEIASRSSKLTIDNIASKLNLNEDSYECFGKYKGKILYNKIKGTRKGKLILVTAISPTPYGEGKTTISIGLHDALNKLGEKSVLVLREPSLGPVFGLKGGATGGGFAQVVPMEDINLHFNGDFHAITSANNLLASAIDNHIKQGNNLDINIEKIIFKRTIDLNDRALREVKVSLGSNINGIPRSDGFDITAASEVMSVFCLSNNLVNLKKNLGNILIAYNNKNEPLFARDLKIEGAMAVLLKDAINPNLVQTLENNPVIIHGGPFANIAHGCNSIIATDVGLKLAEYVVTEAGFGSDLGAVKFFDIKCRQMGIKPDCVVLVVTIKALKYNGNTTKDINEEDIESLERGLSNLDAHIRILNKFAVNIVVCLNEYSNDTKGEKEVILNYCTANNIEFSSCSAYLNGSIGAVDLASKVITTCQKINNFHHLYNKKLKIKDKIAKIVIDLYCAKNVVYSDKAKEKLEEIEKMGIADLSICIAKTQYSISDDSKKLGNPKDYTITVKDVKLYNGSSFITIFLGDIMTMPGLNKNPNYEKIDIDCNGNIVGIF